MKVIGVIIMVLAFIGIGLFGYYNSTTSTIQETEKIKPKYILSGTGGSNLGFIYEYEGKEYILNSEGGILEIK